MSTYEYIGGKEEKNRFIEMTSARLIFDSV